MINDDFFLDENISEVAFWCAPDVDSVDMAQVVEKMISTGVDMISVAPRAVPVVWPWLEDKHVKIISRFYLNESPFSSAVISDFTKNVNMTLKQGAAAVQVFLKLSDLDEFVSQLYLIRDDLFFNKGLFIGVDINSVEPLDWKCLWKALKKIHADGAVFVLMDDRGEKSDFVGRLYALFDSYDDDFNGDLHFILGQNSVRIEQTKRMLLSMQPNFKKHIKFFKKV